jgi:ketosteroid isomerase-like protein
MKALSFLVALSLAVTFTACTSADQETGSADEQTSMAEATDTSAEYAAAMDASVAEWDRALNAGDVEAALALYVPDDPVAMPPDQPVAEGPEAVQALLQQIVDASAEVHNQTVESWVDGEVGVSRGTYTLTPDVPNAPAVTGKWVAISRRQPDGSWKTAANIWNRDAPAGAPAP